MKKVLLVGGGKIGIAITEFLAQSGDYRVTVLDRDAAMLARMPKHNAVQLRDVQMRVGALPVFPHNALKYNLTWSTDGLINEYCNPCESIRDGTLVEVPALEELEQFTLDGVEYEAFNTSGGLGTLCDTLA